MVELHENNSAYMYDVMYYIQHFKIVLNIPCQVSRMWRLIIEIIQVINIEKKKIGGMDNLALCSFYVGLLIINQLSTVFVIV